jgi:hypothetical protein
MNAFVITLPYPTNTAAHRSHTTSIVIGELAMNIDVQALLQFGLHQGLPLALSFLDEVILLILSKVGIQIPGLQWLCPFLLACTLLLWIIRLMRHYYYATHSES